MIEIIQFYCQQKQLFDGLQELGDQREEPPENGSRGGGGEQTLYQRLRMALLYLNHAPKVKTQKRVVGISFRLTRTE